MACRITELVLDCRNPEVLADFWCQVLGFVVLEAGEDDSVEIGSAGTDLDDPGLTLVFSRSTQPKQTKLRLHFDVNAVD
jgi:Glyoxalase-like domain